LKRLLQLLRAATLPMSWRRAAVFLALAPVALTPAELLAYIISWSKAASRP
jgi:hypothetical protein